MQLLKTNVSYEDHDESLQYEQVRKICWNQEQKLRERIKVSSFYTGPITENEHKRVFPKKKKKKTQTWSNFPDHQRHPWRNRIEPQFRVI